MTRPTQARIDLDALRQNYLFARSVHGGRALAVLKADAYGHGAVTCAHALERIADGFAVAFLAEALALRATGIECPILVLEGFFDIQEMREARANDVWVVVHQESQLRMIEEDDSPHDAAPFNVWLKGDSGMRRAGFALTAIAEAHARLQASSRVGDIVLMTHFARADEPEEAATAQQISDFDSATSRLPGLRSLCNSAGVLGWPVAHRDWARPGILLYGVDPMPGGDHGLRPVMTLESRVFAERLLQPGDSLGYGGGFTTKAPMRIGLVAIGYADGYPRHAGTGTPVVVDDCATRLVGRVSMDMLTVDLTDIPNAGIGSRVELWGSQVDVSMVARAAGTVSYELLCGVKRVPLVYQSSQGDSSFTDSSIGALSE